MKPFQAFQKFTALKLHFSSPSYNYFKYSGKVRVTEESFDKRRDRYGFEKLAKRKDPEGFIVSNLLERDVSWIGDLNNQESEEIYTKWLTRMQSLTYNFGNEVKNIDNFIDSCKVRSGQHPKLLELYQQGEISLESLVMLNDILGIIEIWDRKITDTIIWPSIKQKVLKYTPFVQYDRKKIKEIVKEILKHDS